MSILSAYGNDYSIDEMPRVVQEIIPLLGTKEVIGRGNSKTILSWRDEINQAYGIDKNAQRIDGYSDDAIAWCGLAQAYVWFKAEKQIVKNPLWARNWVTAGEAVAERIGRGLTYYDKRRASLGDTLVFVRKGGGGHVGTYICEDAVSYAVAGGNQSDAMTITKILKARCIAVRRPPMDVPPVSVHPIIVKTIPGRTSINEA